MRERIRQVRFKPYKSGSHFRLTLFDVGRTDHMGKYILGYEFKEGNEVIFQGEDFACSPLHAIDSDNTVKSIMGFLTLRRGDTDREYFDNYTERQLQFRDEHAEALSFEVYCRFGE